MVRQQPLNNVARVAYEALAAILGGTQSLQCVSYNEPICLPTEKSHRLAIRTQQVLAEETGVVNVADPLGGSYYVESLTNKLEEEIWKVIEDIDQKGGMIEAIAAGYIRAEMDRVAYQYQREVESGERIVVGKNKYVIPEEEDTLEDEEPPHVVVEEAVEEHVANLKELRRMRDKKAYRDALVELEGAYKENKNLFPYLIEATKAYATIEEIEEIVHYHPPDFGGKMLSFRNLLGKEQA
jgi:methylmalonyl-CoA mutase N-terminal domain/subunit